MSTKLDPGQYDCYKKLADDEPYFLLRAKDPHAPAIVELWAALREAEFGPSAKFLEARACAQEMREWFTSHNGVPLSKRQTLAASPQAGAQREGGQVTPKMMSEVFAASVTNTDPEHEHLYDHRIAAELLNKMLASPPSGEPEPGEVHQVGSPANIRATYIRLAGECFDENGETDERAVDKLMAFAARASVESGERLQSARWLELITEQDIREAYQSAPNWHSVLSSLQCRAIKKYQDATAALVSTPAPSEGNESVRGMADEYEHARHCPVCGSRLDPRQDLRAPLHAWEQRGYERGLELCAKKTNELADAVQEGKVLPSCENPLLISKALRTMTETFRGYALAERGKGAK